ncbi:MAG: hypothetical protein JKX80_02655 [Candidatus Pacebacteria bacterium]|nr:hypothetical protein [Candidatus Paceibacterota bacterium]
MTFSLKILLQVVFFHTALVWIGLIFFVHGIQGIQVEELPMIIARTLGFSESGTQILVFLTGVLDLIVVALLFIHPKKLVLWWVAIWPWVPYFLFVTYAGGNATPIEALLTSIAAGIALLTMPKTTIFDTYFSKKVLGLKAAIISRTSKD